MAKRSLYQKFTESKHLTKPNARNAKREALVGKDRVGQQNREAFTAKTDKEATRATIGRVGEYKKAAKRTKDTPFAKAVRDQRRAAIDKKSKEQFEKRGKAKQHKADF